MRLGRALAGTAAFAVALGIVAFGGAILAGPTLLGRAATEALRGAGLVGAEITVTDLRFADGWDGLRLGVAGDSGALADAAATLDLPLSGRIRLSGALVVAMDGGSLTVAPEDCLTATAEALTVGGQPLALSQGATLCAAAGVPLLRWSPSVLALAAELRAPRLDAPSGGLGGEGLVVTLSQTGQGGASAATAGMTVVNATVARLRSAAKPAPFVPLVVAINAERSGEEPWRITGTAKDANNLLNAALTGRYDPVAGVGRVEAVTRPIALPPGGPGLAAVSPLAATMLAKASGTLSGRTVIGWGKNGLTTSGQATLKSLAGQAGPMTLAGVAGTIALASLSPLVIPDGQRLTIGLLDVGIPLTDGTLRFGYGRDGRLDVDQAQWRWAGGTLRADPFELSPTKPSGTVTLHADGIDAAKLLTLIAVDGLDATGSLTGTLPVTFAGDRVTIDGGVLEAAAPGTLRYDPDHPPAALKGEEGSPTALLLGALTDFHYDGLRVTVDGQAGGELIAGLSLRGANPSFYDGHPVALNLKLSGALDRILRQNLDVYRIPDTVRDRMTGFDHKDP